jgi:diguanylate cyclase (GGDEF)-like protein
MIKNNKDLSLESKGLRYKLKISFYLMSVLPLLVAIYLVSNYTFPSPGLKLEVIVVIISSIFIVASGFYIIWGVVAKVLSLALENDLLSQRLEKLEIKDALTGLYNSAFIRNRLEEEIKRAVTYQRPCAFVLLNVDDFGKVDSNFGSLVAEATLKKISYIIRDSVTEIDRVARTANNEFAIVLPERNKRQAQRIAEEIRKKIEFSFSEEQDANKRLSISGGVSENPLDGVTADELMDRAGKALAQAKADGKNRILN